MIVTYDIFVGIQPMLVSVVKDLAANGFTNKVLVCSQKVHSKYARSGYNISHSKQKSNLCFKWKTEHNIGVRDMTRTSTIH